ncbi:Ig-like domain-containing protein [Arhodomonas sp. SL1]|uniref:Ig-like domain-containing protein n=1 Tax=Arhodomonas sp. SL1 TaxID=3425691 RepID=UPI003F883E35
MAEWIEERPDRDTSGFSTSYDDIDSVLTLPDATVQPLEVDTRHDAFVHVDGDGRWGEDHDTFVADLEAGRRYRLELDTEYPSLLEGNQIVWVHQRDDRFPDLIINQIDAFSDGTVYSQLFTPDESGPHYFAVSLDYDAGFGNEIVAPVPYSLEIVPVPRPDTEAPMVSPGQRFSLAEDAPVGAVLGTVSAYDDSGSIDSFAITGGSAAPWVRIEDDGTLTLTDAGASSPLNDYDRGGNGFSVEVVASDAAGNTSTPRSVSLTVDPALETRDDWVETTPATPTTIDVAVNDSGVGFSQKQDMVLTDPAHGTATLNASGDVRYVPAPGFTGVDVFSYTVTGADGSVSEAEVTVEVLPEEVRETRTLVTEYYVAMFDRAPDAEGLTFWTGKLVDGPMGGEIDLASAMYASDAARTVFPADLEAREVVREFYRNTLGREPDENASGLDFWTGKLESHGEPGRLVNAMLEAVRSQPPGKPDKDLLTNKVTVGEYFATQGPGTVDGSRALIDRVTADSDVSSPEAIEGLIEDAMPVSEAAAELSDEIQRSQLYQDLSTPITPARESAQAKLNLDTGASDLALVGVDGADQPAEGALAM